MNNPFNLASFRLIFIYTLLLSVSFGLVLTFLYFTSARDIQIEADQKIINKVEEINRVYLRGREKGLFNYVRGQISRPTLNIYRLYNGSNEFLAGNIPEPTDLKINEDGWVEFTFKMNINGVEETYYGRGRNIVTPFENLRLLVGRVVNNEIKLKERFFYSSLWSLLLIIFLGIFGGYILSRNFLKRISDINKTSKNIMDGNLSERLPTTKGKDELNQLSSNLNEMLDKLDSLMTSMREVTDNVAHDLRTPLNRIRSNLEVTLMSNPDIEQYKKSIDEAILETDNLIKTFNSILSISRVESGTSDLETKSINLENLILDLIDLYEPIAEAKNIKLTSEIEKEIFFDGNMNLLSQAIANLLENAINYGSSSSKPFITLGAKKNKESISLWVSDNGKGIKDSDKKKVLNRFVRLDSSRSLKGSGLGLNLVNSAVKFHNGSLKLLDAKPSGLIVLIEIPVS
ncbi:MAG: HAMP domain-containing sensor histidine kinase [Pseudomonadota bacterium]|nr:HAMP domain-containing sensor histidine kinase [Pseudomonadota bacterium]